MNELPPSTFNSPEQEKPPVIQLNPETHVSNDFVAQLGAYLSFLSLNDGFELLKHTYKKGRSEGKLPLLQTYEERYPDTQYKDVVNDQNRERIQQINQATQHLQEILENIDTTTEEELRTGLEQIVKLVHGE